MEGTGRSGKRGGCDSKDSSNDYKDFDHDECKLELESEESCGAQGGSDEEVKTLDEYLYTKANVLERKSRAFPFMCGRGRLLSEIIQRSHGSEAR
jgi:hypothetical protein